MNCCAVYSKLGFPQWLSGKESAYSAGDAGDMGLIPGKIPCRKHGNSFQCSRLENPINRGARWATIHGVAKSQTRLSTYTHLKLT